MSEDYLWDGSGEPDPEVQRLERLLGRLRHTRPAPEFPAPPVRFPRTRALFPRLALATAAVLLIAVAWQVLRRSEPAPFKAKASGSSWRLMAFDPASIQGASHPFSAFLYVQYG